MVKVRGFSSFSTTKLKAEFFQMQGRMTDDRKEKKGETEEFHVDHTKSLDNHFSTNVVPYQWIEYSVH